MAARKRKTTTRAKSKARQPVMKFKRRAKPRARKPSKSAIHTGLSPDRKLDITGALLALVGLLTLLALFTGGGGFAGAWLGLWVMLFGWGVYLFPLALITVGLWLLMRNSARFPAISVERLVGLLLIFINILAWLHFLFFPASSEAAYDIPLAGGGGGYVGALFQVWLQNGLGNLGAAVALLGWLVIAAALTLDVSVMDLFRWVSPLVLRLGDYWDERRAVRKNAMPEPHPNVIQSMPISQPSATSTPAANSPPAALPSAASLPLTPDSKQPPEPGWELPKVAEMLEVGTQVSFNKEYDQQLGQVIEETLASFGAPAHVVEINRGPTITQYGVEPDFVESRGGRTRVRVGKIAALADDLSLALAASRIRIQAPVPGKGYVGIEVPNEQVASVALRSVIESDSFSRLRSPLRFALGQDVAGNAVAADLAAMPHLLIAGATGSGKSVCVNALINCLLIHNTPETLRLIMVDPKRVELTGYNGIPHLLAPVVVELERVVGVLQWVTREMDTRYQKFADAGARNIADYNLRSSSPGRVAMPYLVVIIDELADLMMVAPDQTERLVTRMAQLARATGIHLVISTQRPSVDVVTGLIKANIPARISFAVASGTDSRVILDQPGAERLLGQGDMLFQAPDTPAPVRLQGVFVSDPEILRLVQYWRRYAGTTTKASVATGTRPAGAPPVGVPLKQLGFEEMEEQEPKDKLYDEALDLIRRQGRASISMLQRRLRIGYTRSARIIEIMEAEGIVSPAKKGAQTREVLDYGPAAPPVGE